MNVSPNEGGDVKVDNTTQTAASQVYTPANAGQRYTLQAIPVMGYNFDHWGGALSGSANPTTVVADSSKTITVYFVLAPQSVSLNEALNMINNNKDLIVLDVSSVSEFNTSHMLCARNYPWNGTAFVGGIGSLNLYKNNNILIYDQTGTKGDDAADYLAGQGFKSIYYMTAGLDDWIAGGYETFMSAEDGDICTTIPPMAYAGTDQAVNEKTSVTLSGQGWDPDGGAVSYLWTQAQGSTVALSNPSVAKPTFTAPDLISGSDKLIFHLTVTDNEGDKDTDSVDVNVNWINETPKANAGPDQTVNPGQKVTLDGSGSSDPEGKPISFNWTVNAASGINATLSNSKADKPTFTTPNKKGWIEFTLAVTDNGGKTHTDKVKITVQLSPPSNLTAKPISSTQITLGWKDNSTGETGFKIERKIGNCSSANPWTPLITTAANAITYTNSGLTPNTTYAYRLKGYNASGETAYCNCASAITGITGTPNTPANLKATSVSTTTVNLTWTDRSPNETGFKIYRKSGSGAWALLTTTAVNAVRYSDASAANNTASINYQYYIKACNAKGCSPTSNTAILPYTPTGLSAAPGAAGTINLRWTDKSGSETGFEIYRQTGTCAASAWTLVTRLPANTTSWANTSLTSGNTYAYKIRTYYQSVTPYANGYSLWSNCDDATAP